MPRRDSRRFDLDAPPPPDTLAHLTTVDARRRSEPWTAPFTDGPDSATDTPHDKKAGDKPASAERKPGPRLGRKLLALGGLGLAGLLLASLNPGNIERYEGNQYDQNAFLLGPGTVFVDEPGAVGDNPAVSDIVRVLAAPDAETNTPAEVVSVIHPIHVGDNVFAATVAGVSGSDELVYWNGEDYLARFPSTAERELGGLDYTVDWSREAGYQDSNVTDNPDASAVVIGQGQLYAVEDKKDVSEVIYAFTENGFEPSAAMQQRITRSINPE